MLKHRQDMHQHLLQLINTTSKAYSSPSTALHGTRVSSKLLCKAAQDTNSASRTRPSSVVQCVHRPWDAASDHACGAEKKG